MVEKNIADRLIAGRAWHHTFDIVPGVRTVGTYEPEELLTELELPLDLAGF